MREPQLHWLPVVDRARDRAGLSCGLAARESARVRRVPALVLMRERMRFSDAVNRCERSSRCTPSARTTPIRSCLTIVVEQLTGPWAQCDVRLVAERLLRFADFAYGALLCCRPRNLPGPDRSRHAARGRFHPAGALHRVALGGLRADRVRGGDRLRRRPRAGRSRHPGRQMVFAERPRCSRRAAQCPSLALRARRALASHKEGPEWADMS